MIPGADIPFGSDVRRECRQAIGVNRAQCDRCGLCVGVCPEMALVLDGSVLVWLPERCAACLGCVSSCPVGALYLQQPEAQ